MISFSAKSSLHPDCKINGFRIDEDDSTSLKFKLGVDIANFLAEWFSSSFTIDIRTSGSTGIPKTIKIKKEELFLSALATGDFFSLRSGMTALLCLNPNFISGKMMIIRTLVLGLDLTIIKQNAYPLKKTFQTYDFAAMVPLQLINSLSDIKRVKTLIVGGAPVQMASEIKSLKISSLIYETYGMTETISHVAVRQIYPKKQPFFETLKGIDIKIDDRGCLVVQAKRLGKKAIITNDLVEMESNNTFRVLGRYDNVINSGGFKIIVESVEQTIKKALSMPLIILGFPDDKFGEKAILVLQSNKKIDKKSLLEMMKIEIKLHAYEYPKEVVIVSKLPETISGKIDRKKTIKNILKMKKEI